MLDKFDTILLIILGSFILASFKVWSACRGFEGVTVIC